MTAEDLVGVINLDYESKILHPTTGKEVGSYSIRYALMNFVKMSDVRPAIAEAHQSGISKPMHLIVPNTPEAERLITMMNKNLPTYLYHTWIEHGLPEEFVEDLLRKLCEMTMLAARHSCKWDTATKTLTTVDDHIQSKKAKAFEGAAWFKDEFGLLGNNATRNQSCFVAPEALFNLDDAGSCKTIHDRHRKVQIKESSNTVSRTPPRKEKTKPVVNMTGNEEDSASSTSLSSGESADSNDNRSRSQSLSSTDGSTSAAGSG